MVYIFFIDQNETCEVIMGKLGCECGYIMHDITMEEDFLNQLIEKELADSLLKTIDVLNLEESLNGFISKHYEKKLRVCICPQCGRIFIEIADTKIFLFKCYKRFSSNAKTCSCGKINLDAFNKTNIPYYLIKYVDLDEMGELDFSNPEEDFNFCLKHYKDNVRMVYRCFDCDSLLIEDSPKAKTFSLFEYEYK